MTTLVLSLPLPDESAPALRFVLSQGATSQTERGASLGSAPLSQLPKAQEVVAVVPAALLSWHQINLPKIPKARWRQALEGLLEEQLLSDTSDLHLALAPNAAAGSLTWVAVCSKSWLRNALQALQSAGVAVSRVVPEHEPSPAGQAPRWLLAGAPEAARLLRLSDTGVLSLPLGTPSPHSLQAALTALALGTDEAPGAALHCEPALAPLAERTLARPVPLQSAAQTLLAAAQSEWNLAQFELASTGSQRLLQRAAQRGRQWLQAPAWRPVRWGLLGLLAAQVLGLNVWAWQAGSQRQAQEAAMKTLLMQTFPQIKLVLDAPLQMERESSALAQARGLPGPGDLESLLGAVSAAGGPAPSSIEFTPGELRLQGMPGAPSSAATGQLGALGYGVRTEGSRWIVKPLTAGTQP